MKVLIIEDETSAVRNLLAILKEVAPEMEIVATLDSIQKSVEWLHSNVHPDLIFMDIHLADGESFHIFNQIDIASPVIFTTAYDEYALQAFKVNSIDFLLKPLQVEEVVSALNKFKKYARPERTQLLKQQNAWASSQKGLSTLLVFFQDRIIPLKIEQMAWFVSESDRVQVCTTDGTMYTVDKSLASLMNTLPNTVFYRANRQYIISRNAIKEISLWEGNRLGLFMTPSNEFPILVSKDGVASFKRWLQGI